MRRIALLLLFLLCTSCAIVEPDIKSRFPDPVRLPEKAHTPSPEIRPEVSDREKHQARDVEATRLNRRLQEIIADSPLGTREDIFSDRPRDINEGSAVSFSFYDADLLEVIRVFMMLLEEDYLIHPDVTGKVSLFVEDSFNADQLLDLLAGLLRVNNMAMVKSDRIWEILPQSAVPRHISRDRIIFPDTDQTPRRGQIIQGFRLSFIAASEMINIIKPYLSQNAQVYAHESKGVLLVSDYPHTLEKISDLITLFDVSVFADTVAQVFPLRFINADEAADQLKNIAQNFGLEDSDIGPRARVSFLALERLNMVLAVARNRQVMDFVEAWVEGLDRELPDSVIGRHKDNIFVYYVQYGDADKIVESLRGVFDETEQADNRSAARPVSREEEGQGEPVTEALQGQVSGELAGPVRFTVDEATNSIITRCFSVDYPTILSVIEKLDLYPKQVLIEVIIAEVQLSDTTRMGVDWQYLLNLGSGIESRIGYIPGEDTMPGSGLLLSVASRVRLNAALRAAVDDRDLQILSTPTLMASDNKPATINIGDQVPYPTSTRRRIDDTTTAETIDTTFQYRDTGIILQVTPKINKHGMVRMEISQEVSNVSRDRFEGINAPVINTRHTETSLAVDDQQTIVIAGLIKQETSRISSGIPGLNRIPGIRHFFGTSEDRYVNTELLIFITPHVILSRDDSSFLTRSFLNRLDEVKAQMR